MRSLFVLLLSALVAIGSTITNDMREINGGVYNAPIKITPLSTPLSNGTYMVTGPAKTYVPRSGIVTITNIQPGNYSAGQGSLTWYFSVPDDSETYNFAQLATTNVVVYAYTNGLAYPGYVRVNSDDPTPNFLQTKITAGTGITITTNVGYLTLAASGDAEATNVIYSAAGTNITILTNGLLYTISSTAAGVTNPLVSVAISNAPYITFRHLETEKWDIAGEADVDGTNNVDFSGDGAVVGDGSFIGGGHDNFVHTAQGAILTGSANTNVANDSAIVAGGFNVIAGPSDFDPYNAPTDSGIFSGVANFILSAQPSAIGYGYRNTIRESTAQSAIGWGSYNGMTNGGLANLAAGNSNSINWVKNIAIVGNNMTITNTTNSTIVGYDTAKTTWDATGTRIGGPLVTATNFYGYDSSGSYGFTVSSAGFGFLQNGLTSMDLADGFLTFYDSGASPTMYFFTDTGSAYVGDLYSVGDIGSAGVYYGDASGLTNASPNLSTNGASATDGWILSKTGDKTKWVENTGGSGVSEAYVEAATNSNYASAAAYTDDATNGLDTVLRAALVSNYQAVVTVGKLTTTNGNEYNTGYILVENGSGSIGRALGINWETSIISGDGAGWTNLQATAIVGSGAASQGAAVVKGASALEYSDGLAANTNFSLLIGDNATNHTTQATNDLWNTLTTEGFTFAATNTMSPDGSILNSIGFTNGTITAPVLNVDELNVTNLNGNIFPLLATNTPSDGQMLYATSESSAKWDDAPTGGGGWQRQILSGYAGKQAGSANQRYAPLSGFSGLYGSMLDASWIYPTPIAGGYLTNLTVVMWSTDAIGTGTNFLFTVYTNTLGGATMSASSLSMTLLGGAATTANTNSGMESVQLEDSAGAMFSVTPTAVKNCGFLWSVEWWHQ